MEGRNRKGFKAIYSILIGLKLLGIYKKLYQVGEISIPRYIPRKPNFSSRAISFRVFSMSNLKKGYNISNY